MKFRKHRMVEAIYAAHEVNQKVIAFIDTDRCRMRKRKTQHMRAVRFRKNYLQQLKKLFRRQTMEEAVFTDDKQVREENIRQITDKLEEAFADNEEWLARSWRSCLPVSEEDCPQDDSERS